MRTRSRTTRDPSGIEYYIIENRHPSIVYASGFDSWQDAYNWGNKNLRGRERWDIMERFPELRFRRGRPQRDAEGILVTRKTYTRGGTRVKKHTYRIKDLGKPGKTPLSERFYHPKVHMGWRKDQPPGLRREEALQSHKGDTLATARALQALANVTTDARTKLLAKSDADYFFSSYRHERDTARDPSRKPYSLVVMIYDVDGWYEHSKYQTLKSAERALKRAIEVSDSGRGRIMPREGFEYGGHYY